MSVDVVNCKTVVVSVGEIKITMRQVTGGNCTVCLSIGDNKSALFTPSEFGEFATILEKTVTQMYSEFDHVVFV